MGLLSNRVDRDSLKPGDHIYSWRSAYIYAHHGIYVGNDKVIHFTRHGQEVGTGTVLDILLVSSGPARTYVPCDTCIPPLEGHGVVSSCLNCFLGGGILYRFEYAVSHALFLAKARGGTCTLAVSDEGEAVVHRANYLLNNGFGCYNVFKNNCEDFAIYCKTGQLVSESSISQSGQAASIIGGPLSAVLATPLRLVTTNIYGMAASAVGMYCVSRYAADIGVRKDVVMVSAEDLTRSRYAADIGVRKDVVKDSAEDLTRSRYAADIGVGKDVVKVSAEDLTRRLAIGALQVIEPSLPALAKYIANAFTADIGVRKDVVKVSAEDLTRSRYAADIGVRKDVVKVFAEDLTRRLAIGALQVIEPSFPALAKYIANAFTADIGVRKRMW